MRRHRLIPRWATLAPRAIEWKARAADEKPEVTFTGLSYSCILVKADLDRAEARIADAMKKMGYVPAENGEAEVFIYRRPDAGWFDVRCEAFAHAPAIGKFAKLLSKRFQGFALAVEAVDSDFLLLALSNPETNRTTKACVGTPYEDKRPKPDLAAWRTLNPAADFGALFRDEALDAEGGLTLLSEAAGFLEEDVLDPELEEVVPTLTLRFENMDKEPIYIQEGPPVLEVGGYPPGPVRMGELTSIKFMNRNATSTGLDVIVCGPFAEGDEVAFEDAFLHSQDWTDTNTYRRTQPDSVEEVKMENGWRGFEFTFGSFVLPPGFNPKQKKLSGRKLVEAQFACRFSFCFRPRADEKYGFDVCVAAYPRENRDGAAAWNPTQGKTKEEAIDAYNEDQRQHRALAEKYGGDTSQFPLLDKETYMWEGRE